MTHRPVGKVLWDPWFLKTKDEYHLFYLQESEDKAPLEVIFDDMRPASIGHAVSRDLKVWKELPTALKPGPKGSWDDLALWTGSCIEKDGSYFLFYTGRHSDPQEFRIQKIGLATSKSLLHWKKRPGPILEAKKPYAMDNGLNALGLKASFRDPFVFYDEKRKKYFMTISARDGRKEREFNGCVGIAESDDLLDWKLRPPILSPGLYDEIETTQMVQYKGKYYLFFSTHQKNYKRGPGKTGLHCFVANSLFGEYKPVNRNGFVLDEGLFDVRLLEAGDEFYGLGWNLRATPHGRLSHMLKILISGNTVKRI